MRRSQVYRTLDRCVGWLLPPRCVLCRGAGQAPAYDLCLDCESAFPGIRHPCPRCGLSCAAPLSAGTGHCDRCRAWDLPYTSCLAPWAYEFPVTQLVQALKYEAALANARILGTRLAMHASERVQQWQAAIPLVVPMPLHRSRLVERGFNQSREIARVAARLLDLQLAEPALHRVRATAPQVGLGRRERTGNLHGAFAADARLVAGRTVVLVDDVVTTGSTAAEAARTLTAAGAGAVQIWAAARALG
jgi:ComF family protein